MTPPIALREIDINVTNLCNLECLYCSYASTPSQEEPALPAALIHSLLDQAAELGNRVVHFSGGEPVLRPDMPDFISHANRLGFRMRMHSNGMMLRPAKLDELWGAGLRAVLVSLDGGKESHEFHRQRPGLYEKTMEGIRQAVARGFHVRVNSVATTRNVDEIPGLLPMLAEMGVSTFSVFYCIPVGRGREHQELSVPPLRWRSFIEEMRTMAARHAPPTMEVQVEKVFQWRQEWDQPLLDSGRGGSCLGFLRECNYLNVLADGRVYPCVCFIDEGPALGNLKETPLAEILHDPARWSFYQRLAQAPPACEPCPQLSRCRGGCRAHSQVARGDWWALDPRCCGDPEEQDFIPLCYMARESLSSQSYSGFSEKVPSV